MENKEKFAEYYQRKMVSGGYDNQREGTEYRRKKRLLELINKSPNDKLLEIGCSSGFLTQHLGECIAIDTNADMLRLSKEKNPFAKYAVMDMFNMNFPKNSFDKIATMRVWTHLNKDELIKILKKAKEILNEKGCLIFDIEDRNHLRKIINFVYKKIFRITGYKVYQYSPKEIKQILNKIGFKIIDTRKLKHKIGYQNIYKAVKV